MLNGSPNVQLGHDLQTNMDNILQAGGLSPDMIVRSFSTRTKPAVSAAAIYIEGLVEKTKIDEFISRTAYTDNRNDPILLIDSVTSVMAFMKEQAVVLGSPTFSNCFDEVMLSIYSGAIMLLIDGFAEALGFPAEGGEIRPVSEPTTQVVIRGPKDSFNESIGVNISLVRRRIKNPKLWLEKMKLGDVTQTEVAFMYIKDTAKEELIHQVRERLRAVKIDGVLESGYIEASIQDHTFSPFPTVNNSERPDSVAANLLEGRVAIFVDCTPFVLIVPTTFFQLFRSIEDYYHRFDISAFIRILRYLSYLIALFGPSLYIAAITFHQEMIPTPLLISLAAQREGVPFPAFVEAFLMEASFEVMREAGLRMPRAVGQAVSIVGALILGQAAVQAGLVSAAMVIVVAATGIASFTLPAFHLSISSRLLRFVFMILAATFGLYGLLLGSIIAVTHLCSLKSFGIPYMATLLSVDTAKQKRLLEGLPIWPLIRHTRPGKPPKNK